MFPQAFGLFSKIIKAVPRLSKAVWTGEEIKTSVIVDLFPRESAMKRSAVLWASGMILATCISSAAFAGACHTGMAWNYIGKSISRNNTTITGAIIVGCHVRKYGVECDPQNGEAVCKKALPLLCAYRDPSTFPKPHNLAVPDGYYGWAPEVVATTKPVRPCVDFAGTLSAANAYCAASFG